MMQVQPVPKTKARGGRRRFVPTSRDQEIAATIRRNREAKDLTQAELAKLAGVGVRTLIRYESAERAIPEQVLSGIETVVGPCRPPGLGSLTITGSRPSMSDSRSRLPSDLEGFLERYKGKLGEDEIDELRDRGAGFKLPHGAADDNYWWALVQLWRKYDPGPSGGLGG